MVHFDFILAIFMIPVIIMERISDVIWAQAAQAPAVRWSSCEMSHVEILRVCMGKFTTALRIKKNTIKFSMEIPHLISTVHRLLFDRLLC